MDGSCEYVEKAIPNRRQEVVVHRGLRARGYQPFALKTYTFLRTVQNIFVPRPQATEGDDVVRSYTVCNVVKYYSGDEIKKEEVSWACGTYWGGIVLTRF